MTNKPFLEIAGISLRLEERLVFRNTWWAFHRNQHWALVGSNGSGKTLLARVLAGEIPSSGGEIFYNFRPPHGRRPEDCIVFVSFEQQKAAAGDAPTAGRWFSAEQDAAVSVREFLSQESVEEINPFEIRKNKRVSRTHFMHDRRNVLKLLQIETLLARSIPSLSNGEMRKILIARGMLKKPRLLILEDIFTGLDANYRKHLKAILERLIKIGSVRFLLITARPDQLPKGITHILLVDRCRVIAQGARKIMLKLEQIRKLLPSHSHARSLTIHRDYSRECDREELIRMENVSVRYCGREILSGIDWVVRKGESWALTGHNGAGKSTLISLINGDNPQAYANAVYIFGRRRGSGESVWQLKKRIGTMSSELHLHFSANQTCIETVISGFRDTFFCSNHPSKRQRDAAMRLLARFGLAKSADHAFESLSMGFQRMTLLARALVKSPDLLLLDEPCQGLDSAHRAIFLQAVEGLLKRTDTTIIYITHQLDEIPKVIVRMLHLRQGRIFRSV
jgi:molybdate transport system ATP-binding protein